jgi:molybdopterin-binding protein
VTHDYEEALSLTNRTSIIEKGRIMQSGTPGEVFHNPKSPFVANFVGISNFFRGKLLDTDIDPELKIFETSGKQILLTSSEEPNTEGHIILPGNAIIVSGEKLNSSAVNNFQGVIKDFYQTKLGIDVVIDIGFDLTSHITNHSWSDLQFYIGKSVWVSFKASSVNFLRN